MPIYEYQCAQCGHQLESFEKMSDAPLKDCPACGKPTLEKLISAAGFQLKGTGWYATDFRNKGKAPDSMTHTKKSDKTTSVEKSTDTSSSTDTKPNTENKSNSTES